MSAEMANEIKLISGRSHPELSEKIAKRYVGAEPTRPHVPFSSSGTDVCRTLSGKITRDNLVFFASSANTIFQCRLGIEVARTISLNYSNQETSFTVGESVRDEDVFIVQSTATGDVNEGLMELLIMISACRTARSVKRAAFSLLYLGEIYVADILAVLGG
jgi:Phosphoribosylpyrophosphate synthetase